MIVVGAHVLDSPRLTLAQVALRQQPHYHCRKRRRIREATAMVKRIVPEKCCGLIVDVQGFFLSQLDVRARGSIEANTANFVRLLGYFRIPLVVTLERPVDMKEGLPEEIAGELGALKSGLVATFEKDFFDLTKEPKIKSHLARLKKKQAIVAGCETDVCVLQSCLGLLGLGYEVYAVEELLFSSARDVTAAKARMQAEGVVFLSWKTLYFELLEAVGNSRHAEKLAKALGPFPDLPEAAID
jgi:nicotinamidase-related amidase